MACSRKIHVWSLVTLAVYLVQDHEASHSQVRTQSLTKSKDRGKIIHWQKGILGYAG